MAAYPAIEKAARKNIYFIYADGRDRICYLIISGFCANYKKQILIIGVKINYYYTIYKVKLDKRYNFTPKKNNLFYIPTSTKERIIAQRQI